MHPICSALEGTLNLSRFFSISCIRANSTCIEFPDHISVESNSMRYCLFLQNSTETIATIPVLTIKELKKNDTTAYIKIRSRQLIIRHDHWFNFHSYLAENALNILEKQIGDAEYTLLVIYHFQLFSLAHTCATPLSSVGFLMTRPVPLGFFINKFPLWDGAGLWPIKVSQACPTG